MRTFTYTSLYIYIYIYAPIPIPVHMHIHLYRYMYMHTYTCIRVYSLKVSDQVQAGESVILDSRALYCNVAQADKHRIPGPPFATDEAGFCLSTHDVNILPKT